MYRQGDILLIPTSESVPAGAEAVKPVHGRLILADGEATGHVHAVASKGATLYDLPPVADLTVRLLVAEITTALTHEEHAHITVPPGTYRVVRQREYSPEAIRNVTD